MDKVIHHIYLFITSNKLAKSAMNAIVKIILPKEIKRKGVKLALSKNDPVVSVALFFGVYENQEINEFENLVQPNMIFLDIGANLGLYTALANKKMKGTGKIFAFEPQTIAFETLQKTIKINNIKNVIAEQIALSDTAGKGTIYSSPDNGGDNRMYLDAEQKFTAEEVNCQIGDKYLFSHNIDKVDLIKIDTQGYEFFVIEGLKNIIKKSINTITILTEFWPYGIKLSGKEPVELLKLFKILGLKIYDINNKNIEILDSEFDNLVNRYSNKTYTNLILQK